MLFEEGDPAEGLVLVAEGTLRVKRLQVGSLGEVGPGQSIGASSLTSAAPV
ncbi:MAG: cyclic nucleotide-binding domain-containing protein [Phycisphaerae bacterium]